VRAWLQHGLPVRDLAAHGLQVFLPPRWEGAIFRRPPGLGEQTFPVLHLATIPLPRERGDFGSGVVEALGRRDVFAAVFEYGPESVGRALFAHPGLPLPLAPDDFMPDTLQRTIPGQSGAQRFFTERGRAFCLYAVLGSHAWRRILVPALNGVLASVKVDAG